jgi:hypothetical protein
LLRSGTLNCPYGPSASAPLCDGHFRSWLGSKPEVDHQYNHPDCIWIHSVGHPKSVGRFPWKSGIITFLPEVDGRTFGITSAGEEINIALDSTKKANQDSAHVMIPWKLVSSTCARMVSRPWDSLTLLNFCSADRIWGAHLPSKSRIWGDFW